MHIAELTVSIILALGRLITGLPAPTVSLATYQITETKPDKLIELAFKAEGSSFYLILERETSLNSPKIYIIGESFDLEQVHQEESRRCYSYRGGDSLSSYSLELCSLVIWRGVIVRADDYFILSNTSEPSLVRLEHHSGVKDYYEILKGLKIQQDKNVRKFRQTKRATAGLTKVTVQVAVFTEHNVFIKFCAKYSQDATNCRQGMDHLSDYVKTLIIGAGLYYDRVDNEYIRISLQLVAIIHNARQMHPTTHDDVSLFYDLEFQRAKNTAYFVDSAKGLKRFADYQAAYLVKAGKDIDADQSTLISTHSLVDADVVTGFNTVGVAYVGGVCDPLYKSAIVTHKPGYYSLYILAHEIGHSLGASHDGWSPSCPADGNFIMATYNRHKNIQNHFYFSCCSIAQMLFTINEKGYCLDWMEQTDLPASLYTKHLPGVKFNRAEQCKGLFNEKHVPCPQYVIDKNLQGVGYTECQANWCFDTETSVCKVSVAQPVLDGTECGAGSWCLEGICTPNKTIRKGAFRPKCTAENFDLISSLLEKSTEQPEDVETTKASSELILRLTSLVLCCAFFAAGVGLVVHSRHFIAHSIGRHVNSYVDPAYTIPPQYKDLLIKNPNQTYDVNVKSKEMSDLVKNL